MPSNEDRLFKLQIQKLLQAVSEKDVERIKKIVCNGIPNLVNLPDPIQDRYCLHLAVQTNDEALVKVLINLGVDCNVIDSNGCTAFMKAAYYGHYQTLNLLLENFPNANLAAKDNSGKNVVYYCLYPTQRHADCLRSAVHYGADVHLTLKDEKTVLMYACQDGLFECIEILLEANIDVNKQDKMGETALDIVCYYGFNDCARLLLKNGANHNIFNANGEYAVHKAALGGHLGTLQILSAYNANMNVVTNEQETPLHYAAIRGHQAVCKYLIQRGCLPNIKNKNGITAKNLAKGNNYKEAMKECKKGENMKDLKHSTKLHLIKLYDWVLEHKTLIVNKMYECGVCEVTENNDKTNLHVFLDVLLLHKPPVSDDVLLAILKIHDPQGTNLIDYNDFFSGKKYISKNFLVDAGKKLKKGKQLNAKKGKASILPINTKVVKTRMKSGGPLSNYIEKQNQITDCTRFNSDHPPKHPIEDDSYWYMQMPASQYIPVNKAIKCEDELSLKVAVNKGYCVNVEDKYFKTPLMIATLAGNMSAAKMFIQHGADVNAMDNFMWTPLHFACHVGQKDLVEYLLNSGSVIDSQSLNGGTPLMRAVEASKIDVVKLLIERGANVLLKNNKGDSVLEIALSYQDPQITHIIQEKVKQVLQNREKKKVKAKKKNNSRSPVSNLPSAVKVPPDLETKPPVQRKLYSSAHSIAGKNLLESSLSYSPRHAWMPQMSTVALLASRKNRRQRYGYEIDFDNYKAPFEKHIRDLLSVLEETK